MKVRTDGSKIKVFVNDQLVIDQEDGTFENGYFGLSASNSTADFRDVKFENTTNFLTNLVRFNDVSGTWENTLEGKKGLSSDLAFTMSEGNFGDFSYEADMKISGNEGGGKAGSLVFRADSSAKNGYLAEVDASTNDVKVIKLENGVPSVLADKKVSIDTDQSYHLKVTTYEENIKVIVDGQLIHDVNDRSYKSGELGLSVSGSSTIFQNVTKSKNIKTDKNDIINGGFETGDISGWQSTKGEAFTDDHVTDQLSYWGGAFSQQGTYHLWGFSDLHGGDNAVGELHSSYFNLSGSGEINFLLVEAMESTTVTFL